MPAEKKGFLFRHFEKIVCGAVALLLLLAIAVALKRTRGDEIAALTEGIEQTIDVLQQQLNVPAPQKDVQGYPKRLAERNRVEEPGETKDVVWHMMEQYPDIWLGLEKDEILTFRDPIEPGTLKLTGGRDIVKIAEFPLDGDFARVKVTAATVEGSVKLRGKIGNVHVVQAIHVKEGVDARAQPPLELKAVARSDGILLRFLPNPANKQHVVVTKYQIWKKEARRIGAEFTLLDEIPVKQAELSAKGLEVLGESRMKATPGGARRPGIALRPDGGLAAGGEPRQGGAPGMWSTPAAAGQGQSFWREEGRVGEGLTDEEEELSYAWLDRLVVPAEFYVYKVRAVAELSYPSDSEFTEEARVETLSDVDFKLTSGSPRSLRFEVIVHTGAGRLMGNFVNRVGDMIGGIKREETPRGRTFTPFLTGCYVVDYHPVREWRDGKLHSGRIIFVDSRGNLTMRWRGQPGQDELWLEPEADEDTRTRPRPGMRYPGPGVLEEYEILHRRRGVPGRR